MYKFCLLKNIALLIKEGKKEFFFKFSVDCFRSKVFQTDFLTVLRPPNSQFGNLPLGCSLSLQKISPLPHALMHTYHFSTDYHAHFFLGGLNKVI